MPVSIRFPFMTASLLLLLLFFDSSGVVWCCIAAILLHELGHGVAYRLCTKKTGHFTISPGGIKLCKTGSPISVRQELLVLCAGPVANILVAVITFLFYLQTANYRRLCFIGCNLLLGLFNLLPIWFLDGGQLLRILCNQILHPNAVYWGLLPADIGSIILLYLTVFRYSGFGRVSFICFLWYFMMQLITDKRN